MNIIISEISFRKSGCQGYCHKIERVADKPVSNNTLAVDKRPKMSHFQLKFDVMNLIYQGELSDFALSEIPSQRIENSELGQSKEQDQILFSNIREKNGENSVRDKVNNFFKTKCDFLNKKRRKK